ncbi:AAA family ATPase [Longimicrobium sp.]|uniref:AAA family ATPase n=1 Tax=Longimicrobium sp. TaxID=2029185 RepID=UPI002C60D172|nr:MoxR family ATPase [Longimicrobium sp.]HSU14572.1 MoxR family ATPase [Longimicrobium sp.]
MGWRLYRSAPPVPISIPRRGERSREVRPLATAEKEIETLLGDAARLRAQVQRRIVGQERVLEEVIISLLAGGHVLLVGVPGLAKTLLVRTLAQALELDFKRVQFTPDLMPGDITGTEVIEEDRSTGRRSARFIRGPVFTQVLLADEINRTPPKTQAALLEAMQEGRVTAGGEDWELPRPFFVLATQNPIEQEGTYPLPEAQLDRFMLDIRLDYPSVDEEVEILRSTTGTKDADIQPVLDAGRVLTLQRWVREVPVAENVLSYAASLVRATRPADASATDDVKRWVRWGAGPRAGQALILGAKARALLAGRFHVTPDDVRRVALPVLRHRVLVNFHAEAEGVATDDVIARLLETIAPPRSGL